MYSLLYSYDQLQDGCRFDVDFRQFQTSHATLLGSFEHFHFKQHKDIAKELNLADAIVIVIGMHFNGPRPHGRQGFKVRWLFHVRGQRSRPSACLRLAETKVLCNMGWTQHRRTLSSRHGNSLYAKANETSRVLILSPCNIFY